MKRRATLPHKRRTVRNPARGKRALDFEQAQARARRKLADMIALHSYGEPDELPIGQSALRHFKPSWWIEVVGMQAAPRTVGAAREIVRGLRG